jgi:hypothetical protein
MDKPGLLVVEDDEAIRKRMKWALTGGQNVILASMKSYPWPGEVRMEHLQGGP